jgi:hypothetical protein
MEVSDQGSTISSGSSSNKSNGEVQKHEEEKISI